MNLDQSIKNIDQVIANAPMTRYDHDQLKSDLALLVARAKSVDESEQGKKAIDILRRMRNFDTVSHEEINEVLDNG
jgi:hypothetical protein